MKIIKENMDNLDNMLDSKEEKVVALNPVMDDAIEYNRNKEKEVEEITKFNKRYFLGANKQPVPKDPVEPKIELSESLFTEVVEPGRKLGPRQSTLPTGGKDDDWDMFTLVYEELSPSIWRDVMNSTRLSEKPGKRYDYDQITTDYDDNILVTLDDINKFDFAKKVAEAYNLEYDEPTTRSDYDGYIMKIYTSDLVGVPIDRKKLNKKK